MTDHIIHVRAASRLHFGLFAFGREGSRERNYGGAGMMVHEPGLSLSIRPAGSFNATGSLADRAAAFARRWSQYVGRAHPPACEIAIGQAPPQHAGFGVGTQLGLSVAAGMNAFVKQDELDAHQLAEATGRGARSAVGVYGFLQGGLIVEDGKRDQDPLSPLSHRCEFPSPWRVALLRPQAAPGLSGLQEQQAFAELPAVPAATSRQLRSEVSQRMLPALRAADFDAFSRSVTSYGELAGACFAAAQGGPYNGAVLQGIVHAAGRLGVTGVGQSSWGPAIYCFLPNQTAAESFSEQAAEELPDVEIQITTPCNHGAIIKTIVGANPHTPDMSCTLSPNS